MDEEIDRFPAITDSGEEVTVAVFQNMIDSRTLDNPNAEPTPGLKTFILSDGRSLNLIDDGTFTIVQTGEIVRKADYRTHSGDTNG